MLEKSIKYRTIYDEGILFTKITTNEHIYTITGDLWISINANPTDKFGYVSPQIYKTV